MCRWLRREYKLAAHADGLLGRNELKLKLKRKAGKAKMMTAAGGQPATDADDGVSTGWICINVGNVAGGEQEPEHDPSFIGFGPRTSGTKLVVQLMTEEKRGEIDLEGLWRGVMDKSSRRAERISTAREESEAVDPEMDPDTTSARVQSPAISVTSRSGSYAPTQAGPTYQQTRGFHSAQQCRVEENGGAMSSDAADSIETLRSLPHADFLSTLSEDNPLFNKDTVTALLCLEKPFPYRTHWQARLRLCALELQHGLNHYSRRPIRNMLREMQKTEFPIPRECFIEALHAILFAPHPVSLNMEDQELATHYAFRFSLGAALDELERMQAHGYTVADPDVFWAMHTAVLHASFVVRYDMEEPWMSWDHALTTPMVRQMQHKILTVMRILLPQRSMFDAPAVDVDSANTEDTYFRFLESYLQTQDWSAFWNVFRGYASAMAHRGPALYAFMFHGVAATGHANMAYEVLEEYVPEMDRERPPVRIDGDVDLASAVRECMNVAGRDVAGKRWDWVRGRCAKVLDGRSEVREEREHRGFEVGFFKPQIGV